mgnify:CR=1 FL=1
MNEFFTWATLGTYAGCVLVTSLVTQFIKELGALKNIPTRIVSYVVALLVLLAANAIAGTLDLPIAGLCVVNAVVVSLAANGGYDAIKKAA